MDSIIKEKKELIKKKQKELTKTTNKRDINRINNEIKRIENYMRKRALELERKAYINRYIARKERVIEINKRKIKATGQLFFIDNKDAMSSLKADDVLKITNKLNKELEPYKKRIEDAKLCIKRIKEQNYSDIKGYYEHLQLMEDIKNGDDLFPDKLRRKYFGRTFKGVTTYSDSQIIPRTAIPTTKLQELEKKAEKILAASELSVSITSKPIINSENNSNNNNNIKTETKKENAVTVKQVNEQDKTENNKEIKELKKPEIIEETKLSDVKVKETEKETKIEDRRKEFKEEKQEQVQPKERQQKNIYIYRDYSGVSIKEINEHGRPIGNNIIDSMSVNWENENNYFEWYKYKPELKERINSLLKKADELKKDADPQIVDAIILESFQNAFKDREIEEAINKADYLLDRYNQIIINPISKSRVEYNLTNKNNSGTYYCSSKRFKTYYSNCLYQAERAKRYAVLTNLDGNSKIKRIFRKARQIVVGKKPSEIIQIKKVELSKKLFKGIRYDLGYYEKSVDGKGNTFNRKRNRVIIDEIEL